jgi:hypothetical protein
MKWRQKRRRHVSGGEKVYRGARETKEETEAVQEHSHHSHDHDDDDDHASDEHESRRRYKYRVRRRSHRSRNPTLSETGGLPPVKSQEPS